MVNGLAHRRVNERKGEVDGHFLFHECRPPSTARSLQLLRSVEQL